MSLMKWSDRLSVGVEQLDAEHRQLLDRLNEVHEAILARVSRERVDSLFDALIEYTEEHFSHEAASMERLHCAGASKHSKDHTMLLAKEMELKIRYDRGESPSEGVMALVRDWLFEHIRTEDRALGELVNAEEPKSRGAMKLSA